MRDTTGIELLHREFACLPAALQASIAGNVLDEVVPFIAGRLCKRNVLSCASLPQAWPGIALVPKYLASFQDGYVRAWSAADELIALLAADHRFKVRKVTNGTSRFLLEVPGVARELRAFTLPSDSGLAYCRG